MSHFLIFRYIELENLSMILVDVDVSLLSILEGYFFFFLNSQFKVTCLLTKHAYIESDRQVVKSQVVTLYRTEILSEFVADVLCILVRSGL